MAKSNPDVIEFEEDEPVYEVERICGHRHSKITDLVEYYIKWKDYDNTNNTWEKEYNIYSPGLIKDYWANQDYTLEDFRNKRHRNKKRGRSADRRSNSPSKKSRSSPADSTEQYKAALERQQMIKEIEASQLKSAPPHGYTWADIDEIVNVFLAGKEVYFAEIKWKNLDRHTYTPTRLLKKYNPQKLLVFFESRLEFAPPNRH
ncbi:hypothetical protein BDF20DRAFT_914971 [Mycotypha africana]|uniref:uncharacterized protein n=1 Tax=Mycotypha africana TaxID=64632 RepID=UPI0023012569|nr:uncharacterized protein BDF20DRAFT_914971 [Mycotypha africana]KAI8973542.1 hypothetical protein BDF20DRAFT_914971 [Mycotypha africana]